jgi:FkbM family methyltransferase
MGRHITDDDERRMIANFLGGTPGYFVDVGANHPQHGSQTWPLEQAGWRGLLIEPQPDLAQQLRAERRATVIAVACSSPQNAGKTMPFFLAGGGSSLSPDGMVPGAIPVGTIEVPVRTLDAVLSEAEAPAPLDFLSVDVEGHEVDVLRGFSFQRWRPRLILLEDHVGNLRKHRYLTAAGYRLVRYTHINAWYVPADATVAIGWRDRVELVRKYYLALPIRKLRNFSRALRQPFKDRRILAERARRRG